MSNVPSLVAWSDEFSLKMPEIDAQHRVLIDLINQVWSATVASKPDAAKTLQIVEELEKYTLTHFTAEEIFMREMNYGDFKRHKQAHDQFVARISEEKQKIIGGHRLSLEIVHFLKDWLINHILVSDKDYAAHCAQRSAPKSALGKFFKRLLG